MQRLPDFFLSCVGEYRPLSEPRACWAKTRLRDLVRDDYMLIDIDPALIGQSFGLGDKNIPNLLISTRFEGFTLYPINRWPVPVYVFRILDDAILATLLVEKDQVELIAWGTIFRTLEAAIANVHKVDNNAMS